MTVKERFRLALENKKPDRMPATTHHLMGSFLQEKMTGLTETVDNDSFFRYFGLDPIVWSSPVKAGYEENPDWVITKEVIPGQKYYTERCTIRTPKGTLSLVLQANSTTVWITEHLVKEKKDFEIIEAYLPSPSVDVDALNRTAEQYGNGALIRGAVCCFDLFGQPGCWQDLACLYGIEKLILESFDDPKWVHHCLEVLQKRKADYIASTKGARYDVLELGGGDASSTVISPAIFEEFVAPYDTELIEAAHRAGQKIVYHTCGGMMPILEQLADMGPDALETFTPVGMGGDVDLAEAKRRIGGRVCMIGGFDQLHFFKGCTPEETRKEVRRCFKAAGAGGGFILSPSDHFFDADIDCIQAFAEEARACTY